jgi:transcriptional regulator with XRE-family HTH domain
MSTLKQLRVQANLNQPQVADMIKATVPAISNYENGVSLPVLEDMIILEQRFGTRIDWSDPLTPRQKHDVVQNVIELCQRFPVEVVLEAGARFYRRNANPEKLIAYYAANAGSDVEPLFPTDITRK